MEVNVIVWQARKKEKDHKSKTNKKNAPVKEQVIFVVRLTREEKTIR
ncbi:hypothetical protein KKG56_05700 [bacterium]|nr:hypothetical protein [bacterium]